MVRLAVIVETAIYRHGLCQLLRADTRCSVIGEFNADTADADVVTALNPDVILLDAGMRRGPEFCRQLRIAAPAARMVLLGVNDDVEQVIRWAEAGVDGFVSQDEPVDKLATIIEVAARGDFVCPRKLVGRLVGYYAGSTWRIPHLPLTAREAQVVTLLDRGFSNKEIASQLGIEVATTKNHVHNILEKLKIRRRSEVASVLRRYVTNHHPAGITSGAESGL